MFISEKNCLSYIFIWNGLELFYEVSEQTKPIRIKSKSKIIRPWQLNMHMYAMLFTDFQAQSTNSELMLLSSLSKT